MAIESPLSLFEYESNDVEDWVLPGVIGANQVLMELMDSSIFVVDNEHLISLPVPEINSLNARIVADMWPWLLHSMDDDPEDAFDFLHDHEEREDLVPTAAHAVTPVRPSMRIHSRQWFLLFMGLIGALSGLLVGTPGAILGAGGFMFYAGSVGRIGAQRQATWFVLEAGGLGIAILAAVALLLSLF